MRTILRITAIALIALGGIGTGIRAHADMPAPGTCAISPNPVAVGRAYTIAAVGLPVVSPDYLIVGRPDGTSVYYPQYPLAVDPDGSWSGIDSAGMAGTWTYTFSGQLKDHKYGAAASCSVAVR